MKKNIIDIIINIIIILTFILAIYWFIQLMFGNTPGLSEFNSLFIIAIISMLFHLYREVGEIKIEMKHQSKSIRESFNLVKEDMSSLKENMNLIKNKLKI